LASRLQEVSSAWNAATETRKLSLAEQRIAILRRLLEQAPVFDLCDEHGIQP